MDQFNHEKRETPSILDCGQISKGSKTVLNIKSQEYSKLILQILDTVHMIAGKTYEIYPYGLKNSKRKVKDSCVYAGSLEIESKIRINDILLSDKEKGIGRRHFLIQYYQKQSNSAKGGYFIKDLGDGMGTFIRLEQPLKLENDYIVSFGDSHLIIKIDNNNLFLRFIDGPRSEEKL